MKIAHCSTNKTKLIAISGNIYWPVTNERANERTKKVICYALLTKNFFIFLFSIHSVAHSAFFPHSVFSIPSHSAFSHSVAFRFRHSVIPYSAFCLFPWTDGRTVDLAPFLHKGKTDYYICWDSIITKSDWLKAKSFVNKTKVQNGRAPAIPGYIISDGIPRYLAYLFFDDVMRTNIPCESSHRDLMLKYLFGEGYLPGNCLSVCWYP